MKDFSSVSELRSDSADFDDNWIVGDQSEPNHSLSEQELTRHNVFFASLSSSEHENETLHGSMSSLSCSESQMDESAKPTDDIHSGIFELEL